MEAVNILHTEHIQESCLCKAVAIHYNSSYDVDVMMVIADYCTHVSGFCNCITLVLEFKYWGIQDIQLSSFGYVQNVIHKHEQ